MSNISISQRVGAEIDFQFYHPWNDRRGGKVIYRADNFKYGAYSPIYPCMNNRHWSYQLDFNEDELCNMDLRLLVSNTDPEPNDIFDVSHPQEVKNAYLKTSFEPLFHRQVRTFGTPQNIEGVLNYAPLNHKYCRFWINGIISKKSVISVKFRLYS